MFLLVPACLGSPGQRPVKWLCVCVCVTKRRCLAVKICCVETTTRFADGQYNTSRWLVLVAAAIGKGKNDFRKFLPSGSSCFVFYVAGYGVEIWSMFVGITGSSRASWSSSSSVAAAAASPALNNHSSTAPHLRARRSLPNATTSPLQTSPKRPRRYWHTLPLEN